MRLTARFYVRGGIFTTVIAEHTRRGWKNRDLIPSWETPATNASTR
jgi:hypothetical protein